MKSPATLLILVAALWCSPVFLRADGDTPKAVRCVLTLSPEIDCPSCEDGIKHLLASARGVQSADIDVLTNKVVVRYDPARITVRALIGRLQVTGYTATEVK